MKNDLPKNMSDHVTQEPLVPYTPDEGTYVQRTHKDKLFRFIFRDKRKLLQLYNAINQTSYEDVSQLTIMTLENVIYLGYKNDVSFLLDWALCLIEHQSTWNPNIPLRGFLYFARLYRAYIEKAEVNLYGSKQIFLPFPQFLVFYNGKEERPERDVLYLSDSFKKPENMNGDFAKPALECQAVVLNINYGKNKELMEKCKPLLDYSRFISYIRENIDKGYSPQTAVNLAVDRCLQEDVLTDVLREHRKEVVTMFLDEYDDEIFTKRMYKALAEEAIETGWNKGHEAGLKAGHEEGLKTGHEEGLIAGREEGLIAGREEGLIAGREEGLIAGREEGLKTGREEGLIAGREEGLIAGREEGLIAGREEGLIAGREEGLIAGREEGLIAGREEGLIAGRELALKDGLEKINRLNQFLLRDNRQEDLLRSISDSGFQKELLEEYGLSDSSE